jgi:glutaredoxin-dependent peroxiredoxin
MALDVGQLAPDFSLFTEDRQVFTLSDEAEEHGIVLLFFPGAFTSTCTTELNEVSNDLDSFGAGVRVMGLSTDSPFALAEYRRVHGFRFNLLSDHDGDVSTLYGARYNRDFGPMKLDRISKRAAFVIDRNRRVVYAEVLDVAGHLPDLEAVREAAKQIA